MAKFVCSVCGYVHEDLTAPENCPVCMAPASEFSEMQETVVVEDVKEEISDELQNVADHKIEGVEDNEDNTIREEDKSKGENNTFEVDNTNSEKVVDRDSRVAPSEDEIFLHIEQLRDHYNKTGERGDADDSIKWYMEVSGCDRGEALRTIADAFKKYSKLHGLKNIYGINNKGCMITILVAITSTLSVFFLL